MTEDDKPEDTASIRPRRRLLQRAAAALIGGDALAQFTNNFARTFPEADRLENTMRNPCVAPATKDKATREYTAVVTQSTLGIVNTLASGALSSVLASKTINNISPAPADTVNENDECSSSSGRGR